MSTSTRTARNALRAGVLLLCLVGTLSVIGCGSDGEDTTMSDDSGTTSDDTIKQALSKQLSARGMKVAAGDLQVNWFEGDLPDGVRLFRAVYGEGDDRRFVTGIVEDAGQPNTRTNEAVGSLLSHWNDADPVAVANAVAFLMAPEDHDIVLEDQGAIDETTVPAHLQGKVNAPMTVEVDGRPGYQFWWVRRAQVSQVTVHVGADGRAVTEQKLGPDFLEEN